VHWPDLTFKDLWLLILGAIPAWYFARKRLPRGLDWMLTAGAPILPPSVRQVTPDLHVMYAPGNEQIELQQPQINVARVINIGRSDIVPGEVAKGLIICHPNNKLVSVTIVAAHVDVAAGDLKVQVFEPLTVDKTTVEVTGVLPRGSWFDVQILSDGDGGEPLVDGLVVNRTHRMRRLDGAYIRTKATPTFRYMTWLALLFATVFMIGFVVDLAFGQRYIYRTERVRVSVIKSHYWLTFQIVWAGTILALLLALVIMTIVALRYRLPSILAARYLAKMPPIDKRQ